jgi:hypothetical protein
MTRVARMGPAARDAALASGAYGGMGETFEQLDEVLVTLAATS